MRNYKQTWLEWVFVLLCFGAALFVRVYKLDTIPPGLFNDEAANGIDTREILNGATPIFFERNFGREPLFIYLQAGMVWLLGETAFALRLTAAIVGALTIPATYWMVRELFADSEHDSRQIALFSSLFLAFGYWHLCLSRLGFRAISLPLVAAITFALFWRAWHSLQKSKNFPWTLSILTGISLGLCFYTYTSGRFMPFLIALVVFVSLFSAQTAKQRWQKLGLLSVIAIVSGIVVTPLALYFWQHPEIILQRTETVSVFGYAGNLSGAIKLILEGIGKTIGSFFLVPDPNIRHNPAQRAAFDWLLGTWLAIGFCLALVRWRRLPYLFLASWSAILSLPAILTWESLPHFLRSVGMMPAVYVLPVVAMAAASTTLARRVKWRRLLLLLPLPFLLFSATTALSAYYSAWQDPNRFRSAFFIDYIALAERLAQYGNANDTWIITLSPNNFPLGTELYTIDFLQQGQSHTVSVNASASAASGQLEAKINGRSMAYLLRPIESDLFPDAPYTLGDPKNIVRFLLEKYAVYVDEKDESIVGMPFRIYQLPNHASYALLDQFTPVNRSFASQVTLTGIDFGRTAGVRGDPVESTQIEPGQSLWAVLRWRADAPITIDLKSSLYLSDAAGHIVGQSDELLAGERYPLDRNWYAGEETNTYQILPTLPAIAPGNYQLYLRVYENDTLRPYPLVESTSQHGGDLLLGDIEIQKAANPAQIAPTVAITNGLILNRELSLLGHEPVPDTAAAGNKFDVVLFWQAIQQPSHEYQTHISLRSQADNKEVLAFEKRRIGDWYPTTAWSEAESVRTWQPVALPPTLPNGDYQLLLVVSDDVAVVGEQNLGAIRIEGRPHSFEPIPVQLSVQASFGQKIKLLGLRDPLPLPVKAGGELPLCLVWQPLGTANEGWTRFVHLLEADGGVIAQKDSVPCEGACPATSWIQDEQFCDEVKLTLPADLASGNYQLGIGWYDSTTVQRFPAFDAEANHLQNDIVSVPVQLTVEP